ncbi:MAG: hypothetical protein PHE58_02705 [Candidatus Omnitrophica bacterium]|nr:hypothetical protein [Candidatus Omnitrophota bacterium]
MDEKLYQEKLKKQQERHESLCRRCGACCGVLDGDPCVNLQKNADNTYFCRIYETRLGKQKTVSGKEFTCVLIRENCNNFGAVYPGCPYSS